MCHTQLPLPIHALSRPKIGLPNLDFHQFLHSKWLIHSKIHVKKYLCTKFEKNCYSHFWGTHFWSDFQLSLTHFWFFDFLQNLEALCMHFSGTVYKFGVSIFINFGDIKHWIFPTQSHTCIHTNRSISENYFFRLSKPQNI